MFGSGTNPPAGSSLPQITRMGSGKRTGLSDAGAGSGRIIEIGRHGGGRAVSRGAAPIEIRLRPHDETQRAAGGDFLDEVSQARVSGLPFSVADWM